MSWRSFFPINRMVNKFEIQSLIFAIVIYLLIPSVVGLFVSVFGWIPFVGLGLRVVSYAASLYSLVGIVFVLIDYFK